MKFWLGVTDNSWYSYLAGEQPDEVNFWQPSATPPFTNAPLGMPFLFKLKRPNNHIAGGGYFVAYSKLPVSLAWEVFGNKNGTDSLHNLKTLVDPLKPNGFNASEIGCTVLANPFFLPPSRWLADPPGWSSNIVRGKMYDSDEVDGKIIWNHVAKKDDGEQIIGEHSSASPIQELPASYGTERLIAPRLGQASFRVLVTDAYGRRCAFTGENTLITLEAAHIVPYSKDSCHDIRNGLLLRADFHRLFDVGLVGVTPEYKIKISPRIKEMYFNGKAYYRLDGQQLATLPLQVAQRPDPDRLAWHLKNCFQS